MSVGSPVAIVQQCSEASKNDISQKVAEASKEGGVLGFGGVPVSEAEKATLADISKALGTTA